MSAVLCAVLATPVFAAPAVAETPKEKDCAYQGDVVAAVQAARLARVREKKVPAYVAENATDLPEKYSSVVPLVTPWIYGLKMAEIKETDLASAWKDLCLTQ